MSHLRFQILSSVTALALLACGSTAADPITNGANTGGSAGSTGGSGGSGGSAGGSGGSSGTGGSAGASISNPACIGVDAPGAVVACNFPPDTALIAGDDSYLYALSVGIGGVPLRFLRVDKQNGETQELHKDTFSTSLDAEAHARRTAFVDSRILWSAYIEVSGGVGSGMLSVPTSGGGAPLVVTDFGVAPSSHIVVDETHAYFRYEGGPGGVYTLGRVSKAGGFPQEIASVGGRPHAVRGGYLYFSTHTDELKRMPVAGGAAETLVTLPSSDTADHLAFDDTHLYYAQAPAQPLGDHEIHRVALADPFSNEIVVTVKDQGAEPAFVGLAIDGDWLYYQRSGGLQRVKKTGGSPESLSIWGDFGLPVFDSQFLYVSYSRGGQETPIEGVIVKRAK